MTIMDNKFGRKALLSLLQLAIEFPGIVQKVVGIQEKYDVPRVPTPVW